MFFSIVCLIISDQIKRIRLQIVGLLSCKSGQKPDSIVRKLRYQYSHVCYSVELLNESFGMILMFEIPNIFVGVINSLMHLIINAKKEDTSSHFFAIMFLFNHIINLAFICLSSERIADEVMKEALS